MPDPHDEPRSNTDSPGESESAVSMRMLDSIADGLVILDREWRYTYVNAPAARIFDQPRSELLGKCVWDLFPLVLGTEMERQMRRAADERVTREFPGHDAAAERFYENRAFPTPDGGLAVYFRDITERKQADDRLKRSESQLAETQELAHVGSWNWDLDTDLLTWSDEHYRIFGLERPEGPMASERGIDVIHPDDLPRLRRTVDEALRDHKPYDCSLRLRRRDGSVRFVHSRGRTVYDHGGKPVRMYGTVQDVTEREQAERAIRESEERIRQLVSLMPAGVYTCDARGRIAFYNRRAAELWGREPRIGDEEEVFCGSFRLWRADGSPLPRDQTPMATAVVEGRSVRDMEVVIEQPNGARVVVNVNVDPLHDRDGRRVGAINVFEDITGRKRVEEALRLAEERFRVALDAAPTIVVFNQDRDLRYTWVYNPQLGYSAEEIVGKTDADFHSEEDASRLTAIKRGVLESGFGVREEVTVTRGETLFYDLAVEPLRDSSGQVAGITCVVMDITERKRSEEALRTSEELLAADLANTTRLQELSTRFVQAGDLHLLLKKIIAAAAELLGTNKGNIQLVDPSGALRIVVHHGHGPRFVEHFALHGCEATCEAAHRLARRVIVEDITRVAALEGTTDLEVLLDEGIRAIQSTPLVTRDGRFVGMLNNHFPVPHRPLDRDLRLLDVIARMAADFIERSQAEEELRRAKEAAEAANRSKDEFLANVSHEIRTPFGAILGMTELVLETPLTDDQRQCLETVKSAADNLLGLVEELLDFEKIGAGKLELAPADFLLRPMMADALWALGVRAQKKGLELAWNAEPDVPDALVGDARRLRQVLQNLVGNAIKFTRHGEVAVRVEVADGPATGEEVVLRFTVADTGIGIPTDGQERIFRAFEQGDSSTTREYGGTGLGLTIASRLVALMGGEIGVKSEPGKGSTFTFTARFGQQRHPSEAEGVARPSDSTHEAAASPPAVAPLRILVAEDNEFNARHIERLLKQRGHAVRVATDGRQALDLVGEAPFDLLLLDVHMPELDGFQVAQAIRARERASGGHLPVIALTARARPEDRERCLAAGMDDYLSKPVRAGELIAAIERMVSANGGSRANRSETGEIHEFLDPVVLLASCVDDAESLRELCRDFRAFAPAGIVEVSAAQRDRDATRLREAAHKLCGILSAFSTVAATAASDLEAVAARGELDEAQPLVERLETMARELILGLEGLSLETLRRRATTEGF